MGTSAHLTKRSVTLRGHRTSLALEPAFWAALDDAARAEGLAAAAFLARIDEARGADAPLASAVRVALLERASWGSAEARPVG